MKPSENLCRLFVGGDVSRELRDELCQQLHQAGVQIDGDNGLGHYELKDLTDFVIRTEGDEDFIFQQLDNKLVRLLMWLTEKKIGYRLYYTSEEGDQYCEHYDGSDSEAKEVTVNSAGKPMLELDIVVREATKPGMTKERYLEYLQSHVISCSQPLKVATLKVLDETKSAF
jgi:hypothetical protein